MSKCNAAKTSGHIRAVIYARYSTDEQRPESIEDQVERCRRHCLERGWTVVDIYSDAAVTGSTARRPDFERLKCDTKRRVFDVIVVEAVNRRAIFTP
jgi:DNA invertase Pin-like site-specific DNA recombinase